jgi:hypothetical protein
MLGDLIKSTATSPALEGLRQQMVDRGLLVSTARRKLCGTVRALSLVGLFAAVVSVALFHVHIVIGIGLLLLAVLVRGFAGRMRRPVRRAGRREVRRVTVMSDDRVGIVAQHGLTGRIGPFPRKCYVWELLGISPSAGATLRRRKPVNNTSGDTTYASSCSSCSSSSCGADNSGCGSSGSSCGSGDSGSSCSSGSSCGSSCGGGGGD